MPEWSFGYRVVERVKRRLKGEMRRQADADRLAKARNRQQRREVFPRVSPPRGRRMRNF